MSTTPARRNRQHERQLQRQIAAQMAAAKRRQDREARLLALDARKSRRPKLKLTPDQLARRSKGSAAREAKIRTRVIGPHHERNRRILAEYRLGDLEISVHATKGRRAVRIPAAVQLVHVGCIPPVLFERDDEAHKAHAAAKRAMRAVARQASR